MARREGRERRVEFDAGSDHRVEVLQRLCTELGCSNTGETMRRILDILDVLPPGMLQRLPQLVPRTEPVRQDQIQSAPIVPAQQSGGGRFRL